MFTMDEYEKLKHTMDEYEKNEYTIRNERNKIWTKRMKIYYAGAWGMLLFWILLPWVLAMMDNRTVIFVGLFVMAVVFVIWIIWCVAGYIILSCPHCGRHISHMAMRIKCCPFCGTNLWVYSDLEAPKEKE